MGEHNPDATPFQSGRRSPFKDLTNSSTIGAANQEPKKYRNQSAYARMDDHNVAHQQKIDAAQESVAHDPIAGTHSSSIGSVQCTPLSNITNTHTDVAGFGSTIYTSTGQNLEQVNDGRKKEVERVGMPA